MVQNNIENHVQALCVSGIDERAQFVVGVLGILGKSRIGAQEIMNAIAVVGAIFKRSVFEDWAEPYSASAEPLYVGQLVLDSREVATLKTKEIRIIERLVARR